MAREAYQLDGAKLTQARRAARLTRAELAERAGCSSWTVYALERGIRRAGLVLVRDLERVLGVSAQQLGADLPIGGGSNE